MIFRFRYGRIDAFVDNFNASKDKAIIVIIEIFWFTITVQTNLNVTHPYIRMCLSVKEETYREALVITWNSGVFMFKSKSLS